MSSKKKSRRVWPIIVSIFGGISALFIFLNNGLSSVNNGLNIWDKIFNKKDSKEVVQQPSEVTEKTKKFTDAEITTFIEKYNFASVSAKNHGNFDEVKDYLDPAGTASQEQREDINKHSTLITNITEKNPNTDIIHIKKISSTYKVSTSENYDIYKNGIKVTTDQYYHQYILIVDKSNELKVNEHIFRKDQPY
ncbi:hypothetical protein IKQ_00048 [Bacillus cereus VDM053]|nr:hypothetical protein IKQ_00048 [Bacillus cereus VDM053]